MARSPGWSRACAGEGQALGFPALKGGAFLADEVRALLSRCEYPPHDNWSVATGYHFGGYAKKTEQLTRFMDDFQERHQIRLDFVYTGKMMFGLLDLAAHGSFPAGSTIVAVHTGGVGASRGSPLDPVTDAVEGNNEYHQRSMRR